MTADLPPLVQRTVRRLVRAFAPERILLFGSWAKGTRHEGSDVDLLVITRMEGNAAFLYRRARQLAADSFPRIDVVLATPEEVASADRAMSPFLASILGSSITLFDRMAKGAGSGEVDLGKCQPIEPAAGV